MIACLRLLAYFLISVLKSKRRLEAEVVVLQHQLNVLRRAAPSKLRLTFTDRLILVWLYRLFPSLIKAVAIVKPATVLRWHRGGFRLYWRWKSRSKGGRPKIAAEIRQLIREMSLANPLWGAPRIHGEFLKLGIEIGETTVAKYMVRGRRPSSQSWKTFLRNHAAGIAAMDFLVVPTIGFRLLYALVILRHDRRQIASISVTDHPTAQWIVQQISDAFPWDETPRYLIRDRDAAYGYAVRRRLQAMGIRDRPTAPRSPWQNAYAERLVGSIRRECLDHMIVLGEAHLRRILKTYISYYNGARTHLSLKKDAPIPRSIEWIGRISSIPVLGGLHHQYCRT
jgi:transposase InsO family protein